MSNLVIDATGNNLTYKIIGAAMKVHNEIGPGFKEEIYERSLLLELNNLDLFAEDQYPISIEYGDEQVGIFYLDIFVENQVVVEVKAFSHQLTNDELSQVINYLKATGAPIGLLINFGRRKLDYKRVFPGKNIGPVQRVGRDNVRKSI
ncbi:MAG: GxxExxY protein [Anaerolineaceae bacterium]|nr:GxxExxY protein [Anaerolineaceae bacterium]